jgi:mRNA interferase MazF
VEIKQYQVVIVNLDPTLGSEIKKTRPCLVISPDEMNRHLNTLIIAPLTTAAKNYPTRVNIFFQGKKGSVALDQICTIDKKRVVSTATFIKDIETAEMKRIIREMLVD